MLSEHLDGFIAARSYAPTSARQRRSILNGFIEATRDPAPADLTPARVFQWWATIADLSPATRRSHLSAVRTFLAHLQAIGELESNPSDAVVTPRRDGAPPVTLTPDEILRLVAHCQDARERCAVALMLGCGMRVGDVARLQVEDITDDSLRVIVKGGRVRVLPVPEVVRDAVGAYLDVRGTHRGQLLCRADGRPLNHDYVRQLVTTLLKRAEVKQAPGDGRSTHVLRRTCATVMLESGASVSEVMAVLGHESIASTQRYLARPNTSRLLAAVERGPLSNIA